jgi:hypothetical protein
MQLVQTLVLTAYTSPCNHVTGRGSNRSHDVFRVKQMKREIEDVDGSSA